MTILSSTSHYNITLLLHFPKSPVKACPAIVNSEHTWPPFLLPIISHGTQVSLSSLMCCANAFLSTYSQTQAPIHSYATVHLGEIQSICFLFFLQNASSHCSKREATAKKNHVRPLSAFQSFIREQGKKGSAKSRPETFLWVWFKGCKSRFHTNMSLGPMVQGAVQYGDSATTTDLALGYV